jgi:hypothetical protein
MRFRKSVPSRKQMNHQSRLQMNTPGILLVLTILFSVPVFAATPDLATEIEAGLDACETKGDESCKDDIERKALAENAAMAARSGEIIAIKTAQVPALFQNQKTSSGEHIGYRYLGFFREIGYHLIQRLTLESQRLILVSQATGRQFVAGAIPHLSPKRTRLVSVAASESDNTNEVVVWRVTAEELVEEFRYEPKEYALYQLVGWTNENSLTLEKYTISDRRICPRNGHMIVREELRMGNGVWTRSGEVNPETVKCDCKWCHPD